MYVLGKSFQDLISTTFFNFIKFYAWSCYPAMATESRQNNYAKFIYQHNLTQVPLNAKKTLFLV